MLGVVLAGCPAWAQAPGYGQPSAPDEPPGFDQQGGGIGAGNQPPLLVLPGTWSGQMAGTLRQTYQFAPNGHFIVVIDGMAGGLVLRIWGSYLTSRVGPNQIRIESQTDSWAPQQLCQAPTGGAPACQPLEIPRQAVAVATFVAADTIEIGGGDDGGEPAITQHRLADTAPLAGSTPPVFVLPADAPTPRLPAELPPIPLLR